MHQKNLERKNRKIWSNLFLHTFERDLKWHPLEGDIVFELFDEEIEEYPTLDCPKCNVGNFVPKNIYKKIINKK